MWQLVDEIISLSDNWWFSYKKGDNANRYMLVFLSVLSLGYKQDFANTKG